MPALISPGTVYRLPSGRFARVIDCRGDRVRAVVAEDRHDVFGSAKAESMNLSVRFLTEQCRRLRGTPETSRTPV